MAFELKKRKKVSSSSGESFFFDLLLDEQWKATKWQLSNDRLADKEACFKIGFITGYRYLQQVVNIQVNGLLESCDLKR